MQPVSLPQLDKEGYLVDLNTWSRDVADALAKSDGIELNQAHWHVITILRAFYQQTDTSPTMRPLVKLIREKLGKEYATSIYLMTLFGDSPAKNAARIAGLPRPTNCL